MREAELPARHVRHEPVVRLLVVVKRFEADAAPLPVVKDLHKATVQGVAWRAKAAPQPHGPICCVLLQITTWTPSRTSQQETTTNFGAVLLG